MAKATIKNIKTLAKYNKNGSAKVDTRKYEEEFLQSINDDLNMPKAIAVVLKMLKETKSQDVYNTLMNFNQVLGLNFEEENEEIPENVNDLAQRRWQAKKDRDFVLADKLREEISNLGYEVKDTREGYQILKK